MKQNDHSLTQEGKDGSVSPGTGLFPVKRKAREYSFTLLEVIIATGLLVAVVLQVAGGQGSLLEITDYSKKATEATWLAKRIMSEVEANYTNFELKDMDYSEKDVPFPEYKDTDSDFKYTLTIEEWELPLIDFLTGGGGKSEEEKEEDKDEGREESAMSGIPGLEEIFDQVLGEHKIKTAHVVVSWPEGALRNSVSLVYLLTNQKKLDEYILTKVAVWDEIRKKMDPNAKNTPPPVTPSGGSVPPNGSNPNDGTNPLGGGSPPPIPTTPVPIPPG